MTAKRMANCTYGGALVESSPSLAFFEPRGPGSEWAKRTCAICKYAPEAHKPEVSKQEHLKVCRGHEFTEHPGRETDAYYCGCFGWD